MKRFIVTPAARVDLIRIVDYLADYSPAASVLVLARIKDAFRSVAVRPGIGHIREDLADESLRVWTVYSYLIVYRASAKPVEIVRVLHGARDLSRVPGL